MVTAPVVVIDASSLPHSLLPIGWRSRYKGGRESKRRLTLNFIWSASSISAR